LLKEIAIGLLATGLVRESIRHLLSKNYFKVAIETKGVQDFLSHPALSECRVALIDEAAHKADDNLYFRLHRDHPKLGIAVMADAFKFDPMVRAFSNGAMGYIIKDIPAEALVGSLRLVALGEKVVPSAMANRLADSSLWAGCPKGSGDIYLSEREVQVLRYLTLGASNKSIGRKLDISEATVKVHVKAALRKLQVINRTQAAVWAMQHGLFGK